jgi:unsaturated chondroitin disaccharide hydrolase
MHTKNELLGKFDEAMEFAAHQLRNLVRKYPDHFPTYTKNGKWGHGGGTWVNWCEGFLPGQLWLIYQHTGDPWFREKAEHYCRLIEHRKADRQIHDLGFMFWPSWMRWYNLLGDDAVRDVVIEAGRTMALRFREKGQYLSSFVDESSTFVDIMMNVDVIFYAAEQTGDTALYDIANRHSLTTRRFLIRGDGSAVHEGIFDTETGEFLRESTHQGWRSDSSWARGLTWAIYGFGTAYSFTKDARFLASAQSCAEFYIERTPCHGVPPNDWDEPEPSLPYESAAAAIAACGMLRLSRMTGDPIRAVLYRDYALRILDTLTTAEFLAIDTPGWEGILKHGIYHQQHNFGVDESVMFGEHYFVEALSLGIDALRA